MPGRRSSRAHHADYRSVFSSSTTGVRSDQNRFMRARCRCSRRAEMLLATELLAREVSLRWLGDSNPAAAPAAGDVGIGGDAAAATHGERAPPNTSAKKARTPSSSDDCGATEPSLPREAEWPFSLPAASLEALEPPLQALGEVEGGACDSPAGGHASFCDRFRSDASPICCRCEPFPRWEPR
jgi:hypothetical protein